MNPPLFDCMICTVVAEELVKLRDSPISVHFTLVPFKSTVMSISDRVDTSLFAKPSAGSLVAMVSIPNDLFAKISVVCSEVAAASRVLLTLSEPFITVTFHSKNILDVLQLMTSCSPGQTYTTSDVDSVT